MGTPGKDLVGIGLRRVGLEYDDHEDTIAD
jgi:hypothetical protein